MDGPDRIIAAPQIRQRVAALGHAIAEDARDSAPVLVGVLKGSLIFLSDLLRAIDVPTEIDLMSISAFGGSGMDKGGRVKILKDLDIDIGGRDVILVEDLIDTGLTATYLLATLRSREPRSVKVCTLLDKSVRRIAPVELRYVGFECPDRFVVGYGLDRGERYRGLTSIYAIDPAAPVDEAALLAQDRTLLREEAAGSVGGTS